MNPRRLFAVIFAVTLALRLCHLHVLWADEDYHLAAAIQTLHGKLLYRDLWYDKPPLAALFYTLIGGLAGWPLRLFDALYVLAICAALWRFARDLWGDREALVAASLMAFFLNFDLPSAIIPIAPDFFLLLPAILAVHAAWKRQPAAAGLWCAAAFLFHPKGLFVLGVCALFAWRSLPALALGFAIPNLVVLAALAAAGALPAYFRQVWEWSAAYAASSPEPHPLSNGLRRTADWLGFHAALAIGAAAFWWANRKREHYWLAAWLALAFASAAVGARFFPRYFLALLPPTVLMAGCGAGTLACLEIRSSETHLGAFLLRPNTVHLEKTGESFSGAAFRLRRTSVRLPQVFHGGRAEGQTSVTVPGPKNVGTSASATWLHLVLFAALLVPLARFGPRYAMQAASAPWADTALDQDSRQAAALVNRRKHPGDTLFVWGYRPAIFVYTRMPAASQFWDSQPLTGVPADRHLRDILAVLPEQAALNRREFARTRPTFVVDSLSLSNPRLTPGAYDELYGWLAQYKLIARTHLSLIYEVSLPVVALPRDYRPFLRPQGAAGR